MFETLRGRIPKSIDEDEYRKFAVMVALLKQEDGLHVVFEKRAGGLKRQPGEICLPGGARDGNESSETNAIRETMEELKVSREQIHMIAQMDTLYTAYDNKVSVYLCELTDYEMTYNKDEVAEIFTVPLKFFMEVVPRNASNLTFDALGDQFNMEFLTALQSAIGQMSVDGVRISALPSKSMELSKYMATVLDEDWTQARGMDICAVGIASISYDDESKALINMRNQGAMMGDPSVREGFVQSAVAKGLQSAGSNRAGAGQAYMAMGMGMQGAGNFMASASATNAQQMQQQAAAQAAPANGWTCTCGTVNSGNFCTNCGGKKPAPAGTWKCSCGATVTGKFCPECGSKKPEPKPAADSWTCSCGATVTGKFCPGVRQAPPGGSRRLDLQLRCGEQGQVLLRVR